MNNAGLYVSGSCNLACTYCYAGEAKDRPMDGATASGALRYALSESDGALHIGFFGLEPLLRFPQVQALSAEAAERARMTGKRLSFSMNTNGTLVTQEVISWMREYDVSVSLSLDGGRAIHDRNRVFHGGNGSFGRTAGALREMTRAGVKLLVRLTYTPETAPRLEESARELAALGVKRLGVAPALDAPGWETPGVWETIAEQYRRMVRLEHELQQSGQEFKWLDVDAYERHAERQQPRENCGAGTGAATIHTDGTIYPCHRFAARKAHPLGHVNTGVDENKRARFLREVADPLPDCLACPVRGQCRRCPELIELVGKERFCQHRRTTIPAVLNARREIAGQPFAEHAMAIAEIDGKLYVIPDELLKKFEVTREQAEKLAGKKTVRRTDKDKPGEGLWYEIGESDCY
ncbi:MAG: Anaerobic sulfatase-maturating enzyme [Myxococcota bacterium]|nr:Anaerobic sulfatase-maturating enzyme [Myxococcota bacterium]